MSNAVPPLLTALIDDAAVFPPGSAALADAVPAHDGHRASWYSPLIGPLLLPVADLADPVLAGHAHGLGVIGETGAIERALSDPGGLAGLDVRQIESPVAKRGEDPGPGIKRLAALMRAAEKPWDWYFEVPLTWGLMSALDELADLRAEGLRAAAKFRTGGLAAELFPTPVELAAVICACRDREMPFKLTAGLHNAVRHTDAETGLVHHGFLNVLAAVLAAAGGAEPADLSIILGGTDAIPLAEAVRASLERPRPLWVGFGSCSVQEPVADLTALGLLHRPKEHGPTGLTAIGPTTGAERPAGETGGPGERGAGEGPSGERSGDGAQ
ncbi:hypothetical protein KZZ52_01445 [Dactylosporangium sp. AC04546]|uniref:hypothetical protein n=1 Tax=Dactylosporangium sp. AC04546 TaxID=2862460 RepID=UPI001EE085B9|nr:hypothetical protein [Dactylosporangium sp. AC04546]WVK84129.1 hypothetical protein KZZ52_01445 [Dactylosporangium sp. AC04546]